MNLHAAAILFNLTVALALIGYGWLGKPGRLWRPIPLGVGLLVGLALAHFVDAL